MMDLFRDQRSQANAGVTVQDNSKFGRSLVATQNFAPASIVLCEEPLLLSAPETDPLVRQLHAAAVRAAAVDRTSSVFGQISEGNWLRVACWLVAFVKAPDSTQQALLHEVHTTPDPDSPLAATADAQAHIFARVVPTVLSPSAEGVSGLLSQATIRSALLARELNAHDMLGRSAVYLLGSKLAHTCGSPNTQYKSFDGKGYHVALRPIHVGELLTTSYMGERHGLLSCRMRQRMLDIKFGFRCCCELCSSSSVDYMSCLPCPRCAPAAEARRPDGTLPADIALGDKSPAGVLQFDPRSCMRPTSALSGSSSSESSSTPLLPWTCSNCRVSLPDSDEALFGTSLLSFLKLNRSDTGSSSNSSGCWDRRVESVVYDAIYAADEHLNIERVADIKKTFSLLALAGKALGGQHGAMLYALTLHTEVTLAMLSGCGIAVEMLGPRAPAQMIVGDFEHYLNEMEDNWQRIWTWLEGRPHVDGVPLLLKEIVGSASGMLKAASSTLPLLHRGAKGRPLLARAKRLAADLLQKAEPEMEVYSRWPLPQVHPLFEEYSKALRLQVQLGAGSSSSSSSVVSSGSSMFDLMARSGQSAGEPVMSRAAASNSGGVGRKPTGPSRSTSSGHEALSMQELSEFLPPSSVSSSSRGASRQGRPKGKKGGKKRH